MSHDIQSNDIHGLIASD